jgi:UDP-N-acetylmuramoyl-tripeptide--D-alanyl-D-alanine ligase
LDEFSQADSFVEAVKENVSGQQIVAHIMDEMVSFNLYLHGRHQVANALAVLTTVKVLGGDVQTAAQNMSMQEAVDGRGKIHDINGILVVDESYNANPASMNAALDILKNRLGMGRRVAILGDMEELGEKSNSYHQGLAPLLEGVDTVITVGPKMKTLFDALPKGIQKVHYPSQKEVNLQKLSTQLDVGDIIMVKGSNSIFWKWNFVNRLLAEIERLSPVKKINQL